MGERRRGFNEMGRERSEENKQVETHECAVRHGMTVRHTEQISQSAYLTLSIRRYLNHDWDRA